MCWVECCLYLACPNCIIVLKGFHLLYLHAVSILLLFSWCLDKSYCLELIFQLTGSNCLGPEAWGQAGGCRVFCCGIVSLMVCVSVFVSQVPSLKLCLSVELRTSQSGAGVLF